MTTTCATRRQRGWVLVGALVVLAACGGSESADPGGTGTTATTVEIVSDGSGSSTSSTTSSTSTTSPATTVDPALGFTPVPFRTAVLADDADRLREILDASGITVNPYFGSCTSIEFTGWDPARGDIDVFVHQSGSAPCPGDSLGRFFAIRNSTVTVEAAACGDCEPGTGPDTERYLAIRRALEGRPAVHGIIGGGARWGFDGFEEIVLGAPSAPQNDAATTVSPADYGSANWGGGMAPIDGAAFSSPSGNIVCVLGDAYATCGITEHDWTLPEQDCGEVSWVPEYIGVSDRGVEKGMCVGGIEAPVEARVLPYGSSLTVNGIACTSAESGVTCTHVATGQGFRLSRSAVESFG